MIFDMEHFDKISIRKKTFLMIYNSIIKNRECDTEELIKNLNKETHIEFTLTELEAYLKKNEREFSVLKTEIMFDVLEYSKTKDKSLKEKIENYVRVSKVRGIKKHTNTKNDEIHKDIVSNLIVDMNTIINEDKSYEELLEEGLITDNKVYSNANKYIKEIDDETYVDFLISYKQIEKISLEDLSKFSEALEYFIVNITKKLELLNSYDVRADSDKIRCLRVSGEEELNDIYNREVIRLYKWKVKTLETRLNYYVKLNEMIKKLIATKNIDSLEKLTLDKKYITSDNDFIVEQSDVLQKAYSMFDHIKKIHNVSDSRNKVLQKIYNERLIKENN